MDTYSHVLPAMQEEAAMKLDELLTPIKAGLCFTSMWPNNSGIQ